MHHFHHSYSRLPHLWSHLPLDRHSYQLLAITLSHLNIFGLSMSLGHQPYLYDLFLGSHSFWHMMSLGHFMSLGWLYHHFEQAWHIMSLGIFNVPRASVISQFLASLAYDVLRTCHVSRTSAITSHCLAYLAYHVLRKSMSLGHHQPLQCLAIFLYNVPKTSAMM